MAYQIKLDNKSIILKLQGDIDLSETSEIKEAIKSEPKSGYEKFIIEGSSVNYIDSSAVALMLFAKRFIEEQGMLFEIDALSDNAIKVISLAGLASVLKIKESNKVESSMINNSSKSQTVNDSLDDINFNEIFDNIDDSSENPPNDKNSEGFDIKPGDF